jgi:hypothetical protein
MTFNRITLANGKKACEYCDAADTMQQKAAVAHQPRNLNNLTWLIKQDHKTVRNWAKLNGFEYSLVEKVLHKRSPYDRDNIHLMTKRHFDVIMALCDSGYTDVLINEEYVTYV